MTKERQGGEIPLPKVGDKIYVRSREDLLGGLATVTKVELSSTMSSFHLVYVQEDPGTEYMWESGWDKSQAELKEKFGQQRARLRNA